MNPNDASNTGQQNNSNRYLVDGQVVVCNHPGAPAPAQAQAHHDQQHQYRQQNHGQQHQYQQQNHGQQYQQNHGQQYQQNPGQQYQQQQPQQYQAAVANATSPPLQQAPTQQVYRNHNQQIQYQQQQYQQQQAPKNAAYNEPAYHQQAPAQQAYNQQAYNQERQGYNQKVQKPVNRFPVNEQQLLIRNKQMLHNQQMIRNQQLLLEAQRNKFLEIQQKKTSNDRRILDINRICICMKASVINHSEFRNLCESDKLVFRATFSFQFKVRRARPNEAEVGRHMTSAANFFYQRLETVGPRLIDDPHHTCGLRCLHCLGDGKNKNYVAGAASFFNVHDKNFKALTLAFEARLNHLMTCPCCTAEFKKAVKNYSDNRTLAQKYALSLVLTSWRDEAKKCFPPPHITGRIQASIPRPAQAPVLTLQQQQQEQLERYSYLLQQQYQPGSYTQQLLRQQQAQIPPEPSVEDIMHADLYSSFFKIRRRAQVLYTDLTELPSCFEIMESPLVEMLLQSYQLVVGGREQQSVSFQCRHCQGESPGDTPELQGKFMWNLKSDTTSFYPSSLLHAQRCTKIPPQAASKSFLTQQEPNADDQLQINALLKHWKSYIMKEVLPRGKPDMEKIAADDCRLDCYRPFSGHLLSKYGPMACVPAKIYRPDPLLPETSTLGNNDVIVGIEYLRDYEGNRRLRQLISEHRQIFKSFTPPEQSQKIAFTLMMLIFRRGGHFWRFSGDAGWTTLPVENCLKIVTRGLERGFSEMLRPPLDFSNKGRGSLVYDVEVAPLVGTLHGNIIWPGCDASMTKDRPQTLQEHFANRTIAEADTRLETNGSSSAKEKHQSPTTMLLGKAAGGDKGVEKQRIESLASAVVATGDAGKPVANPMMLQGKAAGDDKGVEEKRVESLAAPIVASGDAGKPVANPMMLQGKAAGDDKGVVEQRIESLTDPIVASGDAGKPVANIPLAVEASLQKDKVVQTEQAMPPAAAAAETNLENDKIVESEDGASTRPAAAEPHLDSDKLLKAEKGVNPPPIGVEASLQNDKIAEMEQGTSPRLAVGEPSVENGKRMEAEKGPSTLPAAVEADLEKEKVVVEEQDTSPPPAPSEPGLQNEHGFDGQQIQSLAASMVATTKVCEQGASPPKVVEEAAQQSNCGSNPEQDGRPPATTEAAATQASSLGLTPLPADKPTPVSIQHDDVAPKESRTSQDSISGNKSSPTLDLRAKLTEMLTNENRKPSKVVLPPVSGPSWSAHLNLPLPNSMSFAEQKLAAKRKEYYQQSKKSNQPVASTVAGETSEKRDAPVGVELAAKRPRISENGTPSTHPGSVGPENHGKEASPATSTLCPSLASNITVINIDDDDDDEVIEIDDDDDEWPPLKQTRPQTNEGDGLPPPTHASSREGDIFI